MKCSKCGNESKENEKFCTNCGQLLENKEVIVDEKILENDTTKEKENIIGIIGLICSIICFAIAGLILSIIGLVQSKKLNNKGKTVSIIGIIISGVRLVIEIVVIILFAVGTFSAVEDIIEDGIEEIETTIETEMDVNKVKINGMTVEFPTSFSKLEATGWGIDETELNNDIEKNKVVTVKFGGKTGGAMLGVINNSSEKKKVKDCSINVATFMNPKDDSDMVSFIGGIDYSYSIEDVEEKMESLGFEDEEEYTTGKVKSLKYFKADDKINLTDYVEFSFYDGVMSTVTISSRLK